MSDAPSAMAEGLARIRDELDIPGDFPPEVRAAADDAARHPDVGGHVDRTDEPFVTLDPAGSTDLDQAFHLGRDGDDVLLSYAIADVGAFVRPGDPVDAEAWRRGVTVYLPDGRAPLYPPEIGEGAASLLAGVDRPAVVFRVRVDPDGDVALDAVQRAIVRSRAKLAYATVADDELPDGFGELARRIEAAEDRRGAGRVEFPEQELERVGGTYRLRIRPRRRSEQQNAAMSLATNLAVADVLLRARTGLFRVMPGVDERHLRRLRHSARALGLDWPGDESLEAFERRLPTDDPRAAAFLLAVRRASGGAGYATYSSDERPWHAAVAATYAHATAPLRRLQDRYVIEAVLAVHAGAPVPAEIATALPRLPVAMASGDARAGAAERAAVDLAESVELAGREGELFDAVVTDLDERGARIQLCSPPVVARVDAHHVQPGDDVRVRLLDADPASRSVRFERVS